MNLKKSLTKAMSEQAGRSNGRVAVRHQGGGEKRRLRLIDWKRSKLDIVGRVEAIEYDPIRSADIALVLYPDGERRYILATKGLKEGDTVVSGENVSLKEGSATFLRNIPIGMPIHNIELRTGKGGQLVRGAGTMAVIIAKEEGIAQVKLPSGELRQISLDCMATIGQIGNVGYRLKKLYKAGQ